MKEAACAAFRGTLPVGPVCSSIALLLMFFDGIEHALSLYLRPSGGDTVRVGGLGSLGYLVLLGGVTYETCFLSLRYALAIARQLSLTERLIGQFK